MKALKFINSHGNNTETTKLEFIQGCPFHFTEKFPRHMCYNRLPLLANLIYDLQSYAGTGVSPQYSYDKKVSSIREYDIIFVKTDLLTNFLNKTIINVPIVLVTGVSDLSPSEYDYNRIISNPNIIKWIGVNIPFSNPKIKKVLIGVGEPERINSNHTQLRMLHQNRVPWDQKLDDICVPYHGTTHTSRTNMTMLPKLDFESYMKKISQHKFVVCKRGNGLDTHRFSEILLMGSVPIIDHSGLDDLYKQFPCIFSDDDQTMFTWDEEKYAAFLNMFWLKDSFISDYLNIYIDKPLEMDSTFEGVTYRTASNWLPILPVLNYTTRPIKYLEIGTFYGANLLSVCKTYGSNPESELYCIDPWEDYTDYPEYKGQQGSIYSTCMKNIENSGQKDKIHVCRGYSNTEVPKFEDNFFDIIYIDGNHEPEYVLEDAVLSFRKLKKGGILIFDDYGWGGPDLTQRGIDGFLSGYHKRIKRLGMRESQVFVQKL